MIFLLEAISIKQFRIKYICEYCGKEAEKKLSVFKKSKHHYCSVECKNKAQAKQVETVCEVCGRITSQKQTDYDRHKHHYCSQKCSQIGTHMLNREIRRCEFCGQEFESTIANPKRFCSIECQHQWQKTQTGELSSHYRQSQIQCDWCGRTYTAMRSKISNSRYHFCCTDCRQQWYRNVWSQDERWKLESRERAIKMIESGVFSDKNTTPQIIINEILKALGIKYENEYRIGNYLVDNFLVESNLSIEVMGDYWHCSPVKYIRPINNVQLHSIERDRKKADVILRGTGFHVLFLWEKDIIERKEVCAKLICKYVECNGVLDDYNSFNYIECTNGSIVAQKLYVPFQSISDEEFSKLKNSVA